MIRILVCLLVTGIAVAALCTPEALVEKKKVTVTKTWKGSVANDALQQTAPAAITSAKKLEEIWKAWQVAGEVPKVDFTKEIVVGVYSSGSGLNLAGANLDDNGNLEVLGFGTRDIRPGFRFVLGTVSKDGVKTVNGKELPKE
jgi:hypothetical protein